MHRPKWGPMGNGSSSLVLFISWPDLSLGRVIITRVSPVGMHKLSTLKKFFLSSGLAFSRYLYIQGAGCLVTIPSALTFSNQTEEFTALFPVNILYPGTLLTLEGEIVMSLLFKESQR